MNNEQIKTVVVVGAGTMGRQIAMNTVLNGHRQGYKAIVCDSFPAAVDSAEAWAGDYLRERVAKGRISQTQADQAAGDLSFSKEVDAAVVQADLVIEAIIENPDVKRELFGRLGKLCRPDTVLATNSSNIVSSKLADVTEHPERLLNIHYFNPALVMQLVEIVRGPHTAEETIEKSKSIRLEHRKSAHYSQQGNCGLCRQPHQCRCHAGSVPASGKRHRLCGGHRYGLRKGAGVSDGALPPDGSGGDRCELLCPVGSLCRKRR